MKSPVLPERLKKIYDLIEKGDNIIDVGCDHGLLPLFALLDGKCIKAFATDISMPSLQKTIDLSNLYKVDLQHACCDGLCKVPDGVYDTVIIAGMGGILISDILKQNPLHGIKRYILQPMTAQYELRKYLIESDYSIQKEVLAKDDGKIYNIILAIPKPAKRPSDVELHLGIGLLEDPLFTEYLNNKINQAEIILDNMERSKNENLIEKKENLLSLLQQYKKLFKSIERL